jgi:nicotinate-nucleotide adenylyltransferase
MPERIGIYGGTFDPPHLGHLILAAEARDQLQLSRLLWMLTPNPPHKTGRAISALEQRLEMVQRAIAGNPNFELSRLEMDRPGPHYTLDTLRQLRDLYPSADLILLIGGDSLRDLPAWRDPTALTALCRHIGVLRRPGGEIDLPALEAKIPGLTEKIRFVDAPLIEISGSEIRKRASEGRDFRYYLPSKVYEYIQEQQLYR